MIATLPSATLFWSSLLGLLMVFLGLGVSFRRRATQVSLGDGGDGELIKRLRAFGNFTEFVPMILVLMALIELSGGAALFLHAAGGLLLAARVSHAVFLTPGSMTKGQRLGRQFGAGTTFLLLFLCSVYALILSI